MNAFVSAVISGAAGTYMLMLTLTYMLTLTFEVRNKGFRSTNGSVFC